MGSDVVHNTPDSGNKLDTRWIGPGGVVAREGEGSYQVEINLAIPWGLTEEP